MERLSDLTSRMAIDRQARSIARAVVALGRQYYSGGLRSGVEIVAQDFAGDRMARDIVARGVVAPAAIAGSNFAQTNIATLPAVVGPASASGNAISRALNVGIEGTYGLQVPSATAASDTIFIAEGAPATVKQYDFASVTVLPKKTVFIATASREIIEHTNGEAVIRDLIARNYSLSLDTVMFGSGASSSTTPAGLLYGLSTVGATAGGGLSALVGDLGKLASACAPLGGAANDLIFVGGNAAAMKLAAYLPLFKRPVFISSAVADDSLIALSPSCLVVAGGTDAPLLDVSQQAVLHMEDTNPSALSAVGTPNTIAAPIRSLYQTDTVAIRLRASIDWSLRGGGCAFVSGITW